mmetsp:Transcript_42076/g.116261  ORF Transcript_42076/g.116261 Transcript_42076/m.116261 type:complete len:228 (+) Transcript_42076:646-1329(+)
MRTRTVRGSRSSSAARSTPPARCTRSPWATTAAGRPMGRRAHFSRSTVREKQRPKRSRPLGGAPPVGLRACSEPGVGWASSASAGSERSAVCCAPWRRSPARHARAPPPAKREPDPAKACARCRVVGDAHWRTALMELAKRLNLTEMFMRCLGTAAQVTENSIYIVLFLAFMLAGDAGDDGAHARGAGVRGGLLWSGGGPGSRAAPRSRGEPWPGAKIRARAQDQGS